MRSNDGFTIIELLVVIGISVILAAAAAPLYNQLQVSSQLNDNTALIIQALRIARERSIAGYNNARHGVYFDNNFGGVSNYTSYQGNSFVTRQAAYDEIAIFDAALTVSSTNFALTGADIDINFSKGAGLPSNTGILRLLHSVNDGRNIILNSVGKVEEQ